MLNKTWKKLILRLSTYEHKVLINFRQANTLQWQNCQQKIISSVAKASPISSRDPSIRRGETIR